MIDGKILVHMRAPVQSLTGYGSHAREIADYILQDGRFILALENINWGDCAYIHNDDRLGKYYHCRSVFDQCKKEKIPFDISIHITIPNEFKRTAQFNIGVTAGIEVDKCTMQWIEKCNKEMDVIVVPSQFSKEVFENTLVQWVNKTTQEVGEISIEKPIEVIPEFFEKPEVVDSSKLNLEFPTSVNFLHVGLWGTKGNFGEDRKNIADMLKYFFKFFRRNSNVGLILKTNIVNNSEEDYYHTLERIEQIKSNFENVKCKVYLIHDTFSDEQMWQLYSHPQISAFLSLTHGEGYGRPMLEAAACGLPVIATDWSGHKDFLRSGHGYIPLKYEMRQIPECQIWENVIDKDAKWASVDEKDLKKKLNKFVNGPKFIQDKAKENVAWLEENFSKSPVYKHWDKFFNKYIFKVSQNQNEKNVSPNVNLALENKISSLKSKVKESDKEKVLYIMPQSAGDVLISTAIVSSLLVRHSESDFYFATTDPFKPLLSELDKNENFNIIDFDNKMMETDFAKEVWDVVYNPTINVQFQWSNWLLGNGEYSVRLLEEFAKSCNLFPGDIKKYVYPVEEYNFNEDNYIVFAPGGAKTAKEYKYWDDVISNLKELLPDMKIVQVGLNSEKCYDGVIDARGCTFAQTFYLLQNAKFMIGIDSFPAHAAAATETPHLVLYGSTSANTVCPLHLGDKRKLKQVLVETTDYNGCKTPCYKNECYNLHNGRNCISNIHPEDVCNAIKYLVEMINKEEVKKEVA